MKTPNPQTIFVSGTDTEVGKTYSACLLAKSLVSAGVNVAVYKPVASGCLQRGSDLIAQDAVELWESAGQPGLLDDVCPQKFLAPLAPTQAAKLQGKTVDTELLHTAATKFQETSDILIVEGAGGLLSPLAENFLNVDLCKKIPGARLVIVTANRLGAIHQTLATCAAAEYHSIKPAGIILCSPSPDANEDQSSQSNAAEIESYTDVPILAQITYGQQALSADWIDRLA